MEKYFNIKRFNENGTYDTTFGGAQGQVISKFQGVASGVVIQDDGKIVVVGDTVDSNGTHEIFVLFKTKRR